MDKAEKIFQKISQQGRLHLYEGGTSHATGVGQEFAGAGYKVPPNYPVASDTVSTPYGSKITHMAYGGGQGPSFVMQKEKTLVGKTGITAGKKDFSKKTTTGKLPSKDAKKYIIRKSKAGGKKSVPKIKATPKT